MSVCFGNSLVGTSGINPNNLVDSVNTGRRH